ncbi:uncharacterized protein BT62DRAFT_574888 [Guyanagaster necrorhizus]|uniref:Protein kinase domain-containing protein n=1 Tax=Guyanagaster necrorhizus TaxID=856835 RepID=A0A9P7VHG0_9AGAR|nr:uncharacterized protein BT62DRAFT_574888 [Guyanagaster necrorhizus MCA 3950]KAG7440648.1 hypothetical protein BT62DRAFT_574888 [Guyanagaster necrorhizus MCA 3950]
MMKHLSSADMVRGPRNRTIPILGIIPIPGEEKQRVFVVLPMLRAFNSPPFHCRREFADAFQQILEGIHFMHEHNIVHGDACTSNFMMDATGVCPRSFHIPYPHSYNGVYHVLHERPRCLVAPVSYYIIDFETTRHFPAGRNDARATAMKCQIKNSPEFLCSPPLHNPFCLDVYNVGATFF